MAAFTSWLRRDGWTAVTEVDFVDACARRGDERLYAGTKGRTAGMGLDVDTIYDPWALDGEAVFAAGQ